MNRLKHVPPRAATAAISAIATRWRLAVSASAARCALSGCRLPVTVWGAGLRRTSYARSHARPRAHAGRSTHSAVAAARTAFCTKQTSTIE